MIRGCEWHSDTHQHQHSHGLQTPLGPTDTTPRHSGRLFLPRDKNPWSAASAHWRQLNFPSPVISIRFPGQLGYWDLAQKYTICCFQHRTICPTKLEKKCTNLKHVFPDNERENVWMGLQTSQFDPVVSVTVHIGLLINSKVLHKFTTACFSCV